ncbi:hypothetical protein R3Q06_25505 [Rhodococcus erythropolis]|uniref:hypothetical protein n=1 Tax=Rhodococcus erythropolis TaxID=1833 RepID=UPI0029496D35|nr:hypothetical protein [Rhodococcus erythropolis]MDV6276856.1 hypothetical protein [Rhodococcus erythropolis]
MTANHTTRTRRMARLRKLLYVPLAVSVLAGAVCAGTGIGTAAPIPAPDAVTASAGPSQDWWSLSNDTGQPIYGMFNYQVGPQKSDLVIAKDRPMQQGGREGRQWWHSAFGWSNEYWSGHICYDHKQWNIPLTQFSVIDAGFTLRHDSAGGLKLDWNPIYPTDPSSVPFTYNKAEGPC